ncbi:AbrB/MazE/SpoVT family DNA-binding domain-containing protein [Thermococcus sp.]|uniref:AbrB/MazE/SpoVT family DNA-binding domain-containing protein n=1 Tax=Thermococcus sp. TaxID=35749 RepID=UPI002638F5EE|nr:AbrB/MazE/SpoVT family DNA-binding domain-containing protein [Thermococcus sp.]
MVRVKVSSKGQIVLPKIIREKFDIREGDEIEVLDLGDEIVLVPVKKNLKLRGLVRFERPVREILREVRNEEEKLEAKE